MKLKKTFIICLIIIILILLGFLGIKYISNKNLEREKKELQEIINKYGVLEKENIETTISKFNEQIKNNNTLNLAMDNYLTIDNEQYWYGLEEDIYCFVIPEKFTGIKNKDITKIIGIYYKKAVTKENVIDYIKYLIKANNNELSETEIDEFINKAENLSKNKKVVSNGKGLTLGVFENDEHIEYQITRLYNKKI